MAEDADPAVSMIELQEEFIQHMERGGRKIRTLALVATIAGAYFAANYFLQLIVLPFGLGITSQTVDLTNPSLMVLEVVSLLVAVLWCLYGASELLFQRRLASRIREIRAAQARVAKDYGLTKAP